MAFIAAMGSNGEPDFRQWSMGNWWQNTRLPYGAMALAGLTVCACARSSA